MLTGGCKFIYGLNDPATVDTHTVEAVSQQYGFSSEILAEQYLSNWSKIEGDEDVYKQLYMQPLQLWIYRGEDLVYATANCYMPGLFNLKWTPPDFPPETSPVATTAYPNLAGHLQLLAAEDNLFTDSQSEYAVIVVWSAWMGRQNRIFLDKVMSYMTANNIKAAYFNADNLYPLLSEEKVAE